MLLAAGQTLSCYEILGSLGAGGMGEVYRAKDTRLDREVAIKVLPAEFAEDEERLLRFQREAKLLASLEHPHIGAIHGFESVVGADGRQIHFLVLDYVEGVSLAKRLESGPLALEEALEVCEQIAQGLETAHDKGIVHRDLKPANVMVRPDGNVKILDFGLARVMNDESGTSVSTDSPTITADFTQPGVVLGTAAYMSPEQARGRSVDRRTDIWSFGCVLYECLTGRVLFRGESATDSIGAILHKAPEWALLPPGTPPTVLLLLRRCLAKHRNSRLQAIGDARVELQEAIADPASSSIGLATDALETRRDPWAKAKFAGALVLVAGVAVAGTMFLQPDPPASPETLVQRYSILLPDDFRLGRFGGGWDVSTNGEVTVLTSSGDGRPDGLYVREADRSTLRFLQGTEKAMSPSLSPDGQWVVYCSFENGDTAIKKMSLRGGPPVTLRDAGFQVEWSTDGWIYFVDGVTNGSEMKLMRMAENGGEAQLLVELGGMYFGPQVFPGGTVLLSPLARFGGNSKHIVAWRPGSSEVQTLTEGTSPMWSETGQLVFVREGTLMAAPFDPLELELGSAVPVIEGVGGGEWMGTSFVLTSSGTLYHQEGGGPSALEEQAVVRITMEGVVEALPVQKVPYGHTLISPDGQHIVTTISPGAGGPNEESKLSVLDLRRDVLSPLCSYDGHIDGMLWSPDGRWIYYATHTQAQKLYRIRADGSAPAEAIPGGDDLVPASITADGTLLYVERWTSHREDRSLARMRLNEEFLVEDVEAVPSSQEATVSPDGAWLAYETSWQQDDNVRQVFVAAADGDRGRVQVSREKGTDPAWSPDGKNLYFRADKSVMAVEIGVQADSGGSPRRSTRDLVVSAPAKVFDIPELARLSQVLPDGSGFLATTSEPLEPSEEERRKRSEILVTLHFSKVLERLLGAERK